MVQFYNNYIYGTVNSFIINTFIVQFNNNYIYGTVL